jgi:parallel beta-helix repeat protein
VRKARVKGNSLLSNKGKSADGGPTPPARLQRRAVKAAGLPLLVVTGLVLVLLLVAGGAGAFTRASTASSSAQDYTPQSLPSAPAAGPSPGCNYTVSLAGTTPVAVASSGSETAASAGMDTAAFVNSLLAPHETICLAAGEYELASEIEVRGMKGVTLSLDPGAVVATSANRSLLLVYGSPGTVVRGGEWIGPGYGNQSAIRIMFGSNNTVVERADVSRAGWNGILIYDNLGPSFNVSILDNSVHDNGRYGIQEYSNRTTGMTGTLISGNVALDNTVGGIYANGIAGVSIIRNVVGNTVGDGPGEIGIGVTNGHNDTVTLNQVSHMGWFGIQAYYNNYTVISDNVSTLNAGGEDQSGITNDHSSFDTIAGNLVESNGRYGVYVEKSWNVTVSGNIANGNHGYGIAFYHGVLPVMGRSSIVGNFCSFNAVGGIVLNSAIDNVISMNQCYNNSGYGILLYNDPGQAGSTGNLISDNWLGNEGGSAPTQTFGISEGNDSYGNTLVSNVMVNNTVAATSLVGPDAAAPP